MTMFNRLKKEICKDLEILDANHPSRGQRIESVECLKNELFYVELKGQHRVVLEVENETIRFEICFLKGGSEVIMILTVGFDDDGNCVLTDRDGNSWKPCQVRRKVLEETLF